MYVLTAAQVRAWDQFTIQHEPIASIDLMERASAAFAAKFKSHFFLPQPLAIFCGRGNNGGDGLAIARLLSEEGYPVSVFLLNGEALSPDAQEQKNRLEAIGIQVEILASEKDFPAIGTGEIIIDALFGTGLDRALTGLAAELVVHLNKLENITVSIDMPSGLFADKPSNGSAIVKAHFTYSFQGPKLSLLFPENEAYCGQWQVLDIGLHPDFQPENPMVWVHKNSPWLQLQTYRRHAHKGWLGHALISAGSPEKMGAAVMCASACLRSGSGLLSVAVPPECYSIIQTTTPEAMCRPQLESASEYFLQHAKINAVAAGPGWDVSENMANLLENLVLSVKVPMVLDATALFHLSNRLKMLLHRPPGAETILTPHGGEFYRLFGASANSFERMETARNMAREWNVFIVLKGAFTQVITPGGLSYFNSSGNAGMAKGGSGDVLTGIITSLLAQRYPTTLACILAVYIHGLAGDIAAEKFGQHGMTAMDLVKCLPKAWKTV